MKYPKKKMPNPSGESDRMARRLDQLAEFREFCEFTDELRKDILNKELTTEELLKKYEKTAAARGIHTIMTDPDSGKAMAAAKDLLDRVRGKAVEKTETTHKFEKLKPEQLDSLLITKLKGLQSTDEDTPEKH